MSGEKLVTNMHSQGKATITTNGMHNGGGFDPGDAAAFAAASAPSLPGVPQGQSGFASRGG